MSRDVLWPAWIAWTMTSSSASMPPRSAASGVVTAPSRPGSGSWSTSSIKRWLAYRLPPVRTATPRVTRSPGAQHPDADATGARGGGRRPEKKIRKDHNSRWGDLPR